MKVEIEIREELSKVVYVNAESLEEAIYKVHDMYYSGQIVLNSEDFKEVVILYFE
jgi:nitrogen fixation protein